MSPSACIAQHDIQCLLLAVLPVIVARWLKPGIYIIKPVADKKLKMDTKKIGHAQRDPEPVITDKENCLVRYFSAVFCFASNRFSSGRFQ
jgi:hypothetical protein